MAIIVNDATLVMHLQTDHTSYVMRVMENGELGQLYYGPRIHSQASYPNLATREFREMTPGRADDPTFQLDALKQEYASFGKGDFRHPAYQVRQPNGSRITELTFDHYELVAGKPRLTDLPSTFADQDEDDVQTLRVVLTDQLINLDVTLTYTVFPHQDSLVRSVRFQNQGTDSLHLTAALSAQLDLPDANYDLIQFPGAWARERHLIRHALHSGVQSVGSLRTASSPEQNPFVMLARPTTTDDDGAVFGVNLVYSGNFLQQVEVDHYDTARLLTGIHPDEFEWELTPGGDFQTPEAIYSFTTQGMNQLSQQLTALYQRHLVNPHFATRPRPILINNWEATYFDFDEEKLLAFAQKAKDLGIELFVLDDGWFGHRDDDTTSLGDWVVDPHKLPNGLGHLAQRVHALGLQFGLWFEPEMISIDSDLYAAHPDWMIGAPDRDLTPGRHQFVLDFTRQDVVDYVFNLMSRAIDETQLDYVKWDMNRHITEMFSHQLTAPQQLEMPHRYILGVYQLYQRLIDAYPEVLFESCSSGGGRFDLGMMYYAPQAWTSDDTDAIERLKIQFGTSYGYGLSMMGAHVAATPNYQTGRVTPLATRAAVAYFGDFGYELDITQFDQATSQTVREQIGFYKRYRTLFQFGTFYRLESPFDGDQNVGSWMVVSEDQRTAIAARYQILNRPNPRYLRLYFRGLDPDQQYVVNGDSERYYGDELMTAGFFVKQLLDIHAPIDGSSDYASRLFVITAVDTDEEGFE